MIVLEHYDDVDWKRGEAKTEATHLAVEISWEGETFTVDLGDKNYQDIARYMEELRSAGKVIARRDGTTARPKQKPGYNGRGRNENRELREWVTSIDLRNKLYPDRLAYINGAMKYAYPEWLWKLFDAREDIKDGLGEEASASK